jgi:hypothetical protein
MDTMTFHRPGGPPPPMPLPPEPAPEPAPGILRRLLIVLAVAMVAAGFGIAAAPPAAQAWGYCSHTIIDDRVMLYDLQGYCPTGVWVAIHRGAPGTCTNLGNGNNWAGSVDNTTDVAVLLHDAPDCASGRNLLRNPHTSHPDLFSLGIANSISSIRWGGP